MLSDRVTSQYRGEAGREYHRSKRDIPESAQSWVARVRAEKLSPYIGRDDVVLEYGVGFGWNLAAIRCRKRYGYDVGEFLAAAVAARGIEFVGSIERVPSQTLDVALCHHVLEHVLEPAAVLAEIAGLLRPGGRLLVFAPYEKERRYRRFRPDEPNHHLYSWNAQTLSALISAVGFSVKEARVSMFSYDRFSAVWATRLRAGERGYRLIRWLVHLAFPCLEVRVVAEKR